MSSENSTNSTNPPSSANFKNDDDSNDKRPAINHTNFPMAEGLPRRKVGRKKVNETKREKLLRYIQTIKESIDPKWNKEVDPMQFDGFLNDDPDYQRRLRNRKRNRGCHSAMIDEELANMAENNPIPNFRYNLIRDIMHSLVVAPSKQVSSRKLEQVGKQINETLQTIYQLNLHTASFLSDDDVFESAVKQWVQKKCPTFASFLVPPGPPRRTRPDGREYEIIFDGEVNEGMDAHMYEWLTAPGSDRFKIMTFVLCRYCYPEIRTDILEVMRDIIFQEVHADLVAAVSAMAMITEASPAVTMAMSPAMAMGDDQQSLNDAILSPTAPHHVVGATTVTNSAVMNSTTGVIFLTPQEELKMYERLFELVYHFDETVKEPFARIMPGDFAFVFQGEGPPMGSSEQHLKLCKAVFQIIRDQYTKKYLPKLRYFVHHSKLHDFVLQQRQEESTKKKNSFSGDSHPKTKTTTVHDKKISFSSSSSSIATISTTMMTNEQNVMALSSRNQREASFSSSFAMKKKVLTFDMHADGEAKDFGYYGELMKILASKGIDQYLIWLDRKVSLMKIKQRKREAPFSKQKE